MLPHLLIQRRQSTQCMSADTGASLLPSLWNCSLLSFDQIFASVCDFSQHHKCLYDPHSKRNPSEHRAAAPLFSSWSHSCIAVAQAKVVQWVKPCSNLWENHHSPVEDFSFKPSVGSVSVSKVGNNCKLLTFINDEPGTNIIPQSVFYWPDNE